MLRDTQTLAVGSMLLSGLLWGTTWMPLKHFAAQGLTGLTLTVCTYGAVGAIALPWLLRDVGRWRGQWPLLAGAALGGGLANACFVTAMMQGEVARSMLLFYLTPLWGILGGRVFLGERITPLRFLAGTLAIAGAVLVLGGPAVLTAAPRWTDVLANGAGLFFTVQNLCARAADRVPVSSKTLAAFVGCAIVSLVLLPLAGHTFPGVSGPLAVQLALYAFVWLTLAMAIQAYGVTHLEAGRTAVLVIFELAAAVVTALWIGGERLTVAGWTGAALIVAAAFLEARPAAPAPSPKQEVPA